MSQRQFAEKLQSYGMDVGKNRISDIESGKSFVTDIEVKVFAMFFNVSTDALLETADTVIWMSHKSRKINTKRKIIRADLRNKNNQNKKIFTGKLITLRIKQFF